MENNSKGFANIAILVIILLAAAGVGYVVMMRVPQAPPTRPPSSPAAISISNWKIYRGSDYELKYPSYLSLPVSIGDNPGSLFFVAEGVYPPSGERLVLNLNKLDEFPSVEAYVDGFPKQPQTVTEGDPPITVTYPGYTKIRSTEVGGYPAIEYFASPEDYGNGSVDQIGVFFNWNRRGYNISVRFPTATRERENIQALFEEILSTIRFTSN